MASNRGNSAWRGVVAVLLVVPCVLWLLYLLAILAILTIAQMSGSGQTAATVLGGIGDSFEVLGSLFSGIGIVGLVLNLYMQRRDLDESRDAAQELAQQQQVQNVATQRQLELLSKRADLDTMDLDIAVNSQLYEHNRAVLAVFMDRPHLRRYFFESEPVPPELPQTDPGYVTREALRLQIQTAAEMGCSFLEHVALALRCVSPASQAEWKQLIHGTYRCSPVIRETLARQKDIYSSALLDIVGVSKSKP